MTSQSPPSLPRSWTAAVIILGTLILGYSVIIAGQILLGVIPVLLLVLLYLLWRFVVAVESIADAQQRLAARRERRER
ncbi:hypothetical protein SAMN05192561_11117 [Halopenitus malekzadehii]|uniref:Uncharacterized protein n=1 Tax=Halopenitus malekzadehii TaxID=1267564 RepID=A0A1H6JC27_9EURY|nr:hypothetical protein [Halopenitus malekzadehii]SEH59840.1 hypothetical protein SAMN05192561_11117 [Halopenitus malekzadehii]